MIAVPRPYGQHHVSCLYIEMPTGTIGQVQLLDDHLAALLDFRLILSVLRVLQLVGRTRTARLELYLQPQLPVGIPLVVG